MNGARPPTSHALLTVHFLRQFLENDLVSPDADRSQLLAVVGASVISLTLFITTFMSFKYLPSGLTPGHAAVLSLDDKFFHVALAMIVTALVAAAQWDALAIDTRDAGILEPLPVPAATIRRAKLAAVVILGAAVAVGVNVSSTIVFPASLVINFRQLSVVSMLWLMVTHAIVTVAAAAYGYLTVIGVRETLTALLGQKWFTCLSAWIQGALIVVLGSALLLVPPASNRIAQRGFDGWRAMSPPMWFVGGYEMLAGGIIADLPRPAMTPRQAHTDRLNSDIYRERRVQFSAMTSRGAIAICLTLLAAAVAYLWNARRLTSLASTPPTVRRRHGSVWRIAAAPLLRSPATRAGFHFALAAMWRSNTHRLTLACAAAAGFAMAVVALSDANVQIRGGASPRLLAVQPFLYGALLVGFRHIIRVPAELRANWAFRVAWRERTLGFVFGVKCAAIVALVLPALALVLPLFAFVLGPRLALLHAVLGLAGAVVLLEGLMLTYDKVPFTCTYLPSENMKALAPIYVVAFLIGASMFGRMQYSALERTGAARALTILIVLFAILRVTSSKWTRPPRVTFDEAPATFQRLGLDT